MCEALSGGDDEQRRVIARLLAALDYVATDPGAARASGLDATVVTRNRPDFERHGAPVLTY